MSKEYTAQERYALDITTILENDFKAYEKILKRAKELRKFEVEGSAARLSDFIRELVEDSVVDALKDDNSLGMWLVREVMLGWGVAPYDIIARDILAELAQNEPLYTLEKDGAYKFRGTYEEVFKHLLKDQGQSVDYATTHGGYSITESRA